VKNQAKRCLGYIVRGSRDVRVKRAWWRRKYNKKLAVHFEPKAPKMFTLVPILEFSLIKFA